MSPAAEQRKHDDTAEWRTNTIARIDAIEHAVRYNTQMTSEIKKNTDDIVEFFEAGRGTFRVLKVIGVIAKWITTVAAAVALAFVAWKGGGSK